MKTKSNWSSRDSINDDVKPEAVAGVSRRSLADSLFKAVVHCNFHRTSLLLRSGVSPRVRNDDGQNLLMAALYINNSPKRAKMFEYLTKKGARLCHADPTSGRDVLAWAAYLGRAEQVEFIVDAVSGEVDLHRGDNEGKIPLHHAVIGGHTKVVDILVSHMTKFGLSVDIADEQGLTPYIYARRLARSDIALILSAKGRCSRQQLDSKTFRSVEEWERIGRREKLRQEREEEKRAKHLSRTTRNRRKRLAPVNKHLPRVTVSFFTDDVTQAQSDVKPLTSSRDHFMPSRSVTILSEDVGEADENVTTMTSQLRSMRMPGHSLSAPAASPSLVRPTSSEIESRLQESVGHAQLRPVKQNLSTILDFVSAQCCESYRLPVRPLTPPDEHQAKLGAAALAMVFGRKGKNAGKTLPAVTPDARKSLVSMASLATNVGKFEENLGEKRRRKTGLMSVA